MPDTTLQLNIVANASSAEQALSKLAGALNRVKTAIGKGINYDAVATGIGKIVTALSTGISEDAVSRLERAAAALNQMKGIGTVNVRVTAGSMAPINNIKSTMDTAADSAKDVIQSTERVADSIKEVTPAASNASKDVRRFSDSLKDLVASQKQTKNALGTLIGQFWRIMKMRAIRAIIKEIAKSIKEGLDNYKEYSKAIGGDYYKAVTSMNDATLKMKNSIGAALAPAIQMLIPYIQRAVSWFIELTNVVNQFLALLNGQATWSKAVDVSSEAFEKTKKQAKGASGAIKELLADWDELNIIQSESGGGGGARNLKEAYDYTQMFTEVDKFDEKIRMTVQWIKDNMDLIKKAALLIGSAIAGWEISTLLGGTIGTLLGWATTGIIAALTFDVTLTFDNKYLQTGDPGFLLGNILTTAFGGVIAATLMKKLTSTAGAAYAAVSVILAVSATADLIAAIGNTDVSALDTKNLALAVLAALKLGTAGTFLAHAFASMGWGNAILLGIGATGLVFGAEVGIKAIIGDIQTGEITMESVAAKVVSALTMGGGAFFVAKAVGMELPMAAMTGAAAAALTASVYLMIDLFVGKVQNNNVTLESVVKTAGLAAAAALGFKFLGKRGIVPLQGAGALAAAGFVVALTLGIRVIIGSVMNPEHITVSNLLETAGSGVAAALGAAGMTRAGIIPGVAAQNAIAAGGFFVSLLLGIQVALKDTVNTSGIDQETIIGAAGGAVSTALALSAVTGNYGLGVLGAGIYATVLLGIRVVRGAVDAGKITTENINAALGVGALGGVVTAGVLLKAGAALSTVAIGGVIGGVAIATGLIAIAAITIALTVDKKNVSWYGTETLSEAEVKAFVKTKMFKADAQVELDLIATKVELGKGQRAKIVSAAKEALGTIKVFRLGVDESSTLLTMYGQVDTLLKNIQEYAIQQKTTLTTGISLIPIIDNTGADVSKQFLTTGLAGWTTVTNYMGNLGEQLADAMIEKTTGKLKSDWDVEAVKTIMTKVQKITEAVTGTQMTSEAAAEMKVKTLTMKDLTEDSVKDVLSYYADYEKQIREGYTEMYMEMYTGWRSLAAYCEGIAEAELAAGNEELAASYKKQADELKKQADKLWADMGTSIDARVFEAGAEGRKVVKEWLDSVFTQKISESDVNITGIKNVFADALESGDMKHALQAAASEVTGVSIEAFEILDITGWEYFSDELRDSVIASLSESLTDEQMVDVIKLLGLDPSQFSAADAKIRQWVKENYDSDSNPAYVFAAALDQFGNEQYKSILDAMTKQTGLDLDQILASVSEEYMAKGISFEEFDAMYKMIEQYKEELKTGPEAPDTSAFEDGMGKMQESAENAVAGVKTAFNSLNGMTIGFTGSLFGGKFSVTVPKMMASGGFLNVGEMFIAREAGPEMVGKIGGKSAVANNDQIVNSISGGVEAGMRNANDSTDQLLGQAVALLGQILRKTGTTQPSAAHGRVVRQSLDMYARSGG